MTAVSLVKLTALAAAAARPASSLASPLVAPRWQPAAPGDRVSSGDVDTPALLLNLDVMEANCHALKERLEAARGRSNVLARPHAKALKCAPLVVRTLELLGPEYAKGVCAQTVTEFQALLEGGVRDILLTNQVDHPARLISGAPIRRQFLSDQFRCSSLISSFASILSRDTESNPMTELTSPGAFTGSNELPTVHLDRWQ